jgi:hypothetical protein
LIVVDCKRNICTINEDRYKNINTIKFYVRIVDFLIEVED